MIDQLINCVEDLDVNAALTHTLDPEDVKLYPRQLKRIDRTVYKTIVNSIAKGCSAHELLEASKKHSDDSLKISPGQGIALVKLFDVIFGTTVNAREGKRTQQQVLAMLCGITQNDSLSQLFFSRKFTP